MSSTNKTANYQLSQFVGTDIPSILNDYNGDMRKIDTAIKEVANAGGDNATALAELQATVGQHTTEIGGLNSTVNSLSGRVIGIEGKIPANASAENKLITAEDIPDIPSVEQLEQDVSTLQDNVDALQGNVGTLQSNVNTLQNNVTTINSKIPSNASANNKLATMDDLTEGGNKIIATFDGSDYSSKADMLEAIATAISQFERKLGADDYAKFGIYIHALGLVNQNDKDVQNISLEQTSNLYTFNGSLMNYSQELGHQGYIKYDFDFVLDTSNVSWGLNGLNVTRTKLNDGSDVSPTSNISEFDITTSTVVLYDESIRA